MHGARENGARPAVDPLFRSAAWAYGPRVIGIVLSGNLDDGTSGLLAIKQRAGIAVVQDPQDALFPSMPTSAIENARVDYVVPMSEIAPLLTRLAEEPADDEGKYPVREKVAIEAQIALKGAGTMEQVSRLGEHSSFTCPECQGALWQVVDEGLVRYRCQTGHAFSIDSLQDGQMHAVEAALWAALRALEDQAELCQRVALNGRQRNHMAVAEAFEKKAGRAEQHAAALRRPLEENGADQEEGPLPHAA